ncbi:MAG TPA: hypothetical protein VGD30_06380 [Telluria sp.]
MADIPHGVTAQDRRDTRRVLYALALIMALESFAMGYTHDQPHVVVMPLLGVLFNFASFVWYRWDSDAIGYRRTLLLNIAIILFGPFGFLYYFARSRATGTKARSLLRFLGFLCLLAGASVFGTIAGRLIT